MNVTTIGLDLAKHLFQLHGVNAQGKTVLRRKLTRAQLIPFFAQLPACVVGMEACASAHHFARKLTALGHTVRLMAPQFVRPYRKSHKTDAHDAEAICEAVSRPNMRFVPIKSVQQQAVLSLHRARAGFVNARTAQANQIRGLLGEFGIIIPKGIGSVRRHLPQILADGENGLCAHSRALFERLLAHVLTLDEQIQALEAQINAWHRDDEHSRRLQQIPGIGPLTASALIATIGNVSAFKNARQLAAWLVQLSQRRHPNIAAVALANKNARIVWALLAHDRTYQPGYRGRAAAAA